MNTNVMMDSEFDTGCIQTYTKKGYECWKGWIQMLISIGSKFKDGYECYDGLWIWYRLDSNVAKDIFECQYRMDMNDKG